MAKTELSADEIRSVLATIIDVPKEQITDYALVVEMDNEQVVRIVSCYDCPRCISILMLTGVASVVASEMPSKHEHSSPE
jgi:hypothetical protein